MKLLEIDKVVQSHATPEEPAWVWMEEIPDGADPETWIDVKFFRNKKHAAGGGATKGGGVVSAERLESVGYGVLKSEKEVQMARKREKLKDLDYSSREYWNRLLSEEGMSMSAGLNLHRLVYTGDSQSLDKIQEEQSERDTGRVPPAKGAE